MGQRSTQASTNALVATIAMLAILGLVNFLGVRYAQRSDLTENQLFTLSPQTITVLQELPARTKVWIFDVAPDPRDQDLLENYQRESPRFSYEYVNPQAEPGLAERFAVRSLGEVHLEQGEEERFVQVVTPEGRLSERRLTSALDQLTNPTETKVYFLQGHGERSLQPGREAAAVAIGRMEDDNVIAEPLNLAQERQVPADAAVVVIAGAKEELLPAEVTALRNYLKRPSGLMVLSDPQTDTGLDALLQEWGVTLTDFIVFDPNGQTPGPSAGLIPVVTQYGDHPITQEFNNTISVYPIARPIAITGKPGVDVSPILITSDRTQAQSVNNDGQLEFNEGNPQGQLILGVALNRAIDTPSDSDEETDSIPKEARLVVVGNSTFMTDSWFDQYVNGDVFLNAVEWLSQQDDPSFDIRPKGMTSRRLLLRGQQVLLLAVGIVLVLPLIGFALAIGLWWKRR
ncbi:MAG: ABC transporter [Leptolyngbyaceae cyanobacterium SL_7_1]|nr:ABC transporter [Leptolyngbyaceae cyanobacterium SL_7_1]